MTLEEELRAVEEVVRLARSAATEHVERSRQDLPLGDAVLPRYEALLDGLLVNAASLLAASRRAAPSDADLARSVLASVREVVRSSYVAMTIVERLAGPRPRGSAPRGSAPRSCAFCGKTEAESRLVAGPEANICASCTRLACGVLGVALSEEHDPGPPRPDRG